MESCLDIQIIAAAIAALSGSTFFWMGFYIIALMGGSNLGAGSLNLGCATGGMPISLLAPSCLD